MAGNSLVERDDAWARAAAAGASARAGTGRWLLWGALPGMGRTALLEEAVRRETAGGSMEAVHLRCAREESRFPFAAVRQLFPEADGVPFAEQPAADEQRTFHRLLAHLARRVADRPALLAVDDVHLADRASRRWIGYLTRRLGNLPVLLLLTERSGSYPLALHESTGTATTLEPLSAPAVLRLARAHGHAADAEALDLCVRASAGHPVLLHALLRDLAGPAAADLAAAGRAVPHYRAAIGDWLTSRADPLSRQACLTLSIAAESAPQEADRDDIQDGTPDGIQDGTQHGTRDGDGADRPGRTLLTDRTHPRPHPRPGPPAESPGTAWAVRLFAEPLAREAALAVADPAELRSLRTRIARRLDERGAPARLVATHLLHVESPDEEWMIQSLEDAAEDALQAGRTTDAVPLLRHALTGPLAPDRRAALTLRLGALELPHSADAGIRRLRAALELACDEERAAIAPALGAALVARGRPATAIGVLHRESTATDCGELVRVLQSVAALIASHDAAEWRGAVAAMRDLAASAPPALEPLACGLITEYEAGAGQLSAAEVLERVRPRLSAPVHPAIRTAWLGSAATLLQWADRLDEARALADSSLPAAPALPDLTDIGRQCLISIRAEAALMSGAFHRLVRENTPLLDACTGHGIRMPHVASMVALAHCELGRPGAARQVLHSLGGQGASSSWEWNEVRYARARLHAAEGNWQAALADHLACGSGQHARDFVSPVATPWRSGAALALVRLGSPARARELAEEELAHARVWGTPRTVGRALRACAAASGSRAGLELLEEAVSLLRPARAPVELVEALIDLGRARIAGGNGRKGRDLLDEAHALALRLLRPETPTTTDAAGDATTDTAAAGTGRLVRAAQDALRAASARRTRPTTAGGAALTDAELRIVRLAVRGETNEQICAALHLARRTVETHLTHAYRKLGVTRRTQLTSRLDADADADVNTDAGAGGAVFVDFHDARA
ncbi:LuxR C-terminal-related transcriptional regulator [Streptomyces avidinii]|uniref:LuxR C-terminal-related transcriptional regulator n=1 Tax=Streptomyces avidinii TaxID=1895 RepID=UPI00386D9BAA|nr:LuxR C-terminal-related transcriptional regulator [Streptomyces avidinii]WTB02201.1 LuxR C-terminal-related transcriptional regulator [Streptomyces avidinii]